MPKRKTLIIVGHPASESLCEALALAYADGAQRAGHTHRTIHLGHTDFDPILRDGYRAAQALEPALAAAHGDIRWADELVFVFPIWWGGMPAQLKGFLDRVLLPGFAFRYEPDGKGLTPLLKGKTARLIITMDTPRWIDRWLYGSPVIRQLKYPILRFCGIKLREVRHFGPVIKSKPAQREQWLEDVRRLASRA